MEMLASEKKKEDWMNNKWRPMMGCMYMGVCVFDFVIAPILWSIIQAHQGGQVNVQWQPLTLQGAGLFHVAMGAVLGLAAYGRTQEKLGGVSGTVNMPTNAGTTYVAPPMTGAPQPMQPTMQPVQTTVMSTYSAAPGPVAYKGGKPAPMQPDFPEL